jgi:hypothetical protein
MPDADPVEKKQRNELEVEIRMLERMLTDAMSQLARVRELMNESKEERT